MWSGPDPEFIRTRYFVYLSLDVDGDTAAEMAQEDGEEDALRVFIEQQPVSNGGLVQ